MTAGPTAPTPDPVFLRGTAGRLFAIYHPPAGEGSSPGVLYVPPFAEEMNRARRMAAAQARALAAAGFGVLLLDLFGTGDSAGDFGDATWEQWRDDIATGLDALTDRGHQGTCLLGLRSGALLACDAAARAGSNVRRVVLWQPVSSGRNLLTQFLRLRVAAAMAEGSADVSTRDARTTLASGDPVEVAGYEISPALAASLDAARLDAIRLPPSVPIDWIEVVSDAQSAMAPAAARVVDAWRAAGSAVRLHRIVGEPFWTIQEFVTVSALIDKTVDVFEDRS